MRLKKYADFSRKSGKVAIQIKDDYYVNLKNARNRKILIIFLKSGQNKKRWMVSLMQNEGKTDNRKTLITVSFDDFSASSENVYFLAFFHQYLLQNPAQNFESNTI